jgi:hypothetical protein
MAACMRARAHAHFTHTHMHTQAQTRTRTRTHTQVRTHTRFRQETRARARTCTLTNTDTLTSRIAPIKDTRGRTQAHTSTRIASHRNAERRACEPALTHNSRHHRNRLRYTSKELSLRHPETIPHTETPTHNLPLAHAPAPTRPITVWAAHSYSSGPLAVHSHGQPLLQKQSVRYGES